MINDSKSFCIYPWIHQVVLPTGAIGFCCVGENGGALKSQTSGEPLMVPRTTLSEAWNSPEQIEIRKKMLAGDRVSACKLCYFQESIGKRSYRQMHNDEWLNKMPELVDRVNESANHNFSVAEGSLYLDLRLGNLCNLKCRMCNPFNSTKIAFESKRLLENESRYKEIHEKYNGSGVQEICKWYEDENFWQSLDSQIPFLRKIYLTGGEPTLIKKNATFLKRCIELGYAKQIFLMFNINCTQIPEDFALYAKEFEFVLINASIDGVGSTNDYIRSGTNWKTIDKNFDKLLQIEGKIQIGVTPTVQIYNINQLPKLVEYTQLKSDEYEKDINVDFLFVTEPAYLRVENLPRITKQNLLKKWKSFSNSFIDGRAINHYLKNSVQSTIKLLENSMETENLNVLNEFLDYTEILDRSRGESFKVIEGSIYFQILDSLRAQ